MWPAPEVLTESNSRYTLKAEPTDTAHNWNGGMKWKTGATDGSKASGLTNQGMDERETHVWNGTGLSLECAKFELSRHYQHGDVREEADTEVWKLRKESRIEINYV